jgi:hypothetical protein
MQATSASKQLNYQSMSAPLKTHFNLSISTIRDMYISEKKYIQL